MRRQYNSVNDAFSALTSLCNRLSVAWCVLFLAYVIKDVPLEYPLKTSRVMQMLTDIVKPPFGFLGFVAYVTHVVSSQYIDTHQLLDNRSRQRAILYGYCIPVLHLIMLGIISGGFEAREGRHKWPLILLLGQHVFWFHTARCRLALAGQMLAEVIYQQWSTANHIVAVLTCCEILLTYSSVQTAIWQATQLDPLMMNVMNIIESTINGQAAGTLVQHVVTFAMVEISAGVWMALDSRKLKLIALVGMRSKFELNN
jgi:hypothetical protein